MGPWTGWLGGWAIAMTGVLVVGSLADVAVSFGLLAVGLDSWADNAFVRQLLTVLLIIVMTGLCVIGTELSAKVQNVLILAQVAFLLVFVIVALYRVYAGTTSFDSIKPSVEWLNPFGAGGAALTGGLLLGVFIYWGWESAVNLTEEVEDSASAPGKAGVWSTVILLVTYLSVGFAVVAFAGTAYLAENAEEEEFIFALLAGEVMGGWDWIVLLAVATSALASTQTTIIPASRTALSMARRHALPAHFARISPRFRTPDVSTWWVAAIAIAWYLVVSQISENALFDSLTALSLLIAFYYALTGVACAIYYRRHLTESVRNFLLIGLGPRGRSRPADLAARPVGHGHVRPGELLQRHLLVRSRARRSSSASASPSIGVVLMVVLTVRVAGLLGRTTGCGRPRPRTRARSPEMSVVLGYDESPGAARALRAAIEVAARVRRAARPGLRGGAARSHRRGVPRPLRCHPPGRACGAGARGRRRRRRRAYRPRSRSST